MIKYLILVAVVGLLAACGTAEGSTTQDIADPPLADVAISMPQAAMQVLPPAPVQTAQALRKSTLTQDQKMNGRVKARKGANQLRQEWQFQTNACTSLHDDLQAWLDAAETRLGERFDFTRAREEFISDNRPAWNTCRAHPKDSPPTDRAQVVLAVRQGVAGDIAELTLDMPYEKIAAEPSRTLFATNYLQAADPTELAVLGKVDSYTVTPELRTIRGLGDNPTFVGNTLVTLPCSWTIEMHVMDGSNRVQGEYVTRSMNCAGFTSLDPATTSWEDLEQDIVTNIALRFDVDIEADALEAHPDDLRLRSQYIREQIREYLD